MTFIDPDYTTISEFIGTSNDYHPHGDILAGEGYLRDVHDALVASPQWERMVFVLNFDENGGFYDHVGPRPSRTTTSTRTPAHTPTTPGSGSGSQQSPWVRSPPRRSCPTGPTSTARCSA